MKNEAVSNINTTDAEKYLVYNDGTPFVDFGGPGMTLNANSQMCIYYPSVWNDARCSDQKDIICEFDSDNLNGLLIVVMN